MKPLLWMGLLAAAALSLYAAQQPDDGGVEVVNRSHGSSGSRSEAAHADEVRSKHARHVDQAGARTAGAEEADPLVLASLVESVDRWQTRSTAMQPWPGLNASSRMAWASQRPPPPPPPVQIAEPPPAPPMAPPFPYAWVGRYIDRTTRAVVAGPQQTWVVQANDVIEGQWRVDAIDEHEMSLTYLPLQQSQTLNLK